MTETSPKLARRLRISGILLGLGLALEGLTMAWSHPTAFLVFLLLGGTMVGLGVLLYLYAIASA